MWTFLAAASLLTMSAPDRGCAPGPCGELAAAPDGILATRLAGLQAASFVLDSVPDRYPPSPLLAAAGPAATAAQRLDDRVPYRVVIGIRDLRTTGTSLFIEGVRLWLAQVRPVRAPLRVLTVGAPEVAGGNPYQAAYDGQPPGTMLPARYAGNVAEAHPQLMPGETDQLAIAVTSSEPVTLEFQVELTYRVGSELRMRSFTLPYRFRVTFSDELNWLPYEMRQGRLEPA